MSDFASVLSAAQSLPPDERGLLIDALVVTLPEESAGELHPDWKQEIERRVADLEAGAPTISWEEVRREARWRKQYKRCLFLLAAVCFVLRTTVGFGQDEPTYSERIASVGGDGLQLIAPPFPADREAWYAKRFSEDYERNNHIVPTRMVIEWTMTNSRVRSMTYSNDDSTPPLKPVLPALLGLPSHEIFDEAGLGNTGVAGDFVVAANAKPERIVDQLNAILRDKLGAGIKLEFAMRERDVYVARGEYAPRVTPIEPRTKRVKGDLRKFLQGISGSIGMPVISEANVPPDAEFDWSASLDLVWEIEKSNQQADIERLLEDSGRQTGFTFTRERREMQVLAIRRRAE